ACIPARDAGPGGRTGADLAAVRGVAVVRFMVAVTATVVGLVGAGVIGAGGWGRRVTVLYLLVGVVWLPWTALLVATSARPGRSDRARLALFGGPVGDVAVVFAAQSLAPRAWGLFLLADAVVLSVAAVLWRGRAAWLLLGPCVGLTLVAQAMSPAGDQLAVALLMVSGVALAGLVVVVGRIARTQRQTVVRSRRYQQKAETIVARVADGIVVTDGAGVILECNPAGQRLIGGEGRSAVGVACSRALGLRVGERALDCRDGCPLVRGEPGRAAEDVEGREVWRVLPDGRRQPLLASAFVVTDDWGGVEVVHSLRDITRLKEADEAKTLFLATASHELKTPATVIAGFADAIRQFPGMPQERREEAVEAIHRRALELSSIVDRLLLSSKIEGGRVAVDLHGLDVRPLLGERAAALQDATGRHVILQVAHERLMAEADGLALRTVLDYLLDNAVKYSDGGFVVLGGRLGDDTVTIWVSDVGIGMEEEQARRCFEKFWQAESTDVRRFGGTGIGLYIVRSLVDAMGGRITVETAVGRGSTFTVELPAALPAALPAPAEGLVMPTVDPSSIKDFMRQVGVLTRGSA
ncbi:MAG: PAS domain-containing sensor histidine kinase, partial [Actinomycetota bacterium]|nr:PAS domain-containing sensor histidine kinase [Actinomycetota bacterium]